MTEKVEKTVPFSDDAAQIASDPVERKKFFEWIFDSTRSDEKFNLKRDNGVEEVVWTKKVFEADSSLSR